MAQMTTIYDLEDESGPAEIYTHTVKADEFIANGRGRYVRELPDGVMPGPKSGTATHHRPGRIVLS